MEVGDIKVYVVNFVFMILKKDFYYLVCFFEKYREFCYYRIDRM